MKAMKAMKTQKAMKKLKPMKAMKAMKEMEKAINAEYCKVWRLRNPEYDKAYYQKNWENTARRGKLITDRIGRKSSRRLKHGG